MPRHTCGGQKATLWSPFCPSTLTCIPGIGLSSPGMQSKYLYPLNQLISPSKTILEADIFLPNTKQKGQISDSQVDRSSKFKCRPRSPPAACLHWPCWGMLSLGGSDRGLCFILSELAPLKRYNYQQVGDNSQRPISDQPSLFFQRRKLSSGPMI